MSDQAEQSLKTLVELKNRGLISDSEFISRKKELVIDEFRDPPCSSTPPPIFSGKQSIKPALAILVALCLVGLGVFVYQIDKIKMPENVVSDSKPSSKNIIETRFGKLVIDGEFGELYLTWKGSRIYSSNASGLVFEKSFSIGNEDAVLLQTFGGTACPARFLFLIVTEDKNPIITDEFGTCSDTAESVKMESSIKVSMPSFMGPFESDNAKKEASKTIHTFILKDNKVSEISTNPSIDGTAESQLSNADLKIISSTIKKFKNVNYTQALSSLDKEIMNCYPAANAIRERSIVIQCTTLESISFLTSKTLSIEDFNARADNLLALIDQDKSHRGQVRDEVLFEVKKSF